MTDLITRKPTAYMVELLRKGAADPQGRMTIADHNDRTQDGLLRRDMADVIDAGPWMGYLVINNRGRAYLAKLDAAQERKTAQEATKHTRTHDAHFLDADGNFRADRSQQAYMSAVDNADQTAREEGYERGTDQWFRVVLSSYASLIDDGTYTEPTQEAPTAPASAPTHYTATGPDGHRLTRGSEVSDNGRAATFIRVASATEILVEWDWLNQRETVTADHMGVTITAHAPQESRDILSTDHSRCEHRKTLTHDHAPTCPVYADGRTAEYCTCHHSNARCEEQQQAATPATVEWTHTVRGHRNGTATINGHAYRITHITHADHTRGALGDHLAYTPDTDNRRGTLIARTWGLADLLGALADHADAAPGPLALTETGRERLARR